MFVYKIHLNNTSIFTQHWCLLLFVFLLLGLESTIGPQWFLRGNFLAVGGLTVFFSLRYRCSHVMPRMSLYASLDCDVPNGLPTDGWSRIGRIDKPSVLASQRLREISWHSERTGGSFSALVPRVYQAENCVNIKYSPDWLTDVLGFRMLPRSLK